MSSFYRWLTLIAIGLSLGGALAANGVVAIRAEFTSSQQGEAGYLRILGASDTYLSGFSIPIKFSDSRVKIDSVVLAPQLSQLGFVPSNQISTARDRVLARIIPNLSSIPEIRPNNDELLRIHYRVDAAATPGFVVADTFVVRYEFGSNVWWDRLEASDNHGVLILPTFDYGGITILLGPPTDAEDDVDPALPRMFRLGQNFPNPFNPSTTFSFYLPRAAAATIEVFDVFGRVVRRRDFGYAKPGEHRVEVDLTGCPSGVYFYRVATLFGAETRKMILLK